MSSYEYCYVPYSLYMMRSKGFYDIYKSVLDGLVNSDEGKKLSTVTHCLAIGPGSGTCEIELIKLLMHQLSTLTAIEPDQTSANELRKNLSGQLQSIASDVQEKTIEHLFVSGLHQSYDVVTIFRVLYYVSADARRQLFGEIYKNFLKPDGVVVVMQTCRHDAPDSVMKIVSTLLPANESACLSADEIQLDMIDSGFRMIGRQEFNCEYDFSDVDQLLAEYFADWVGHNVTVQELSEAVQNIWPGGSYRNYYALMWFGK